MKVHVYISCGISVPVSLACMTVTPCTYRNELNYDVVATSMYNHTTNDTVVRGIHVSSHKLPLTSVSGIFMEYASSLKVYYIKDALTAQTAKFKHGDWLLNSDRLWLVALCWPLLTPSATTSCERALLLFDATSVIASLLYKFGALGELISIRICHLPPII